MAKPSWQVPVDECGFVQNYVTRNSRMIDPFEFDATLYFNGFSRGRSAAHAIWLNEADDLLYPDSDFNEDYRGSDTMPMSRPRYVMFLKELEEHFRCDRGPKVRGTWQFVKRGTNFGIKLKTLDFRFVA